MELTGIVDSIRYKAEGFSIASLIEDSTDARHTIIGNLNLVIGEHLSLKGAFGQSDYGIQFKVKEYQRDIPKTESGISALLGSGLIKGIGPKRADWMIKEFGTGIIDIIKSKDKRLLKVPGIGTKLAKSIYSQWHQFYGKERLITYLADSGFSRHMIRRVMREFDDERLDKIEQNPFELMCLPGVGFRRADYLARKLGFKEDNPRRIERAIIYLLENNGQGHTYLPKGVLYADFKENISFEDTTAEKQVELYKEALATLSTSKNKYESVVVDNKGVHLLKFVAAEAEIAKNLIERSLHHSENLEVPEIMEQISQWEYVQGFSLTNDQRTAIVRSMLDNVTIITGSPGTGKTSTLAALLHVADWLNYKVKLAAPTGRAAKRMTEATGKEATTIHRLLGYGKDDNFAFEFNSMNKIQADLIVIDEISMIDVMLMLALLNAMEPETILILVGDKDQLQSVSAGNVLDDIIKSGKINTIQLREIFRQDSNALLVKNSMIINDGRVNNNINPLRGGKVWGESDFYVTSTVTHQNVIDVVNKHIPNKYGIDSQDVLIISPLRKRIGDMNCTTLNDTMQNIHNPHGQALEYLDCTFRVGDKVMQMSNDYIKDIFNGDIGYIVGYRPKVKGRLSSFDVDFYGTTVTYEATEWKKLSHAWATTIHKAQGSEADAVVCILPDSWLVKSMLTRNLLYTGITRAKKVCVLMSKDAEIIKAIETSGTETRYTDLTDKIEFWYNRNVKLRNERFERPSK
mgnify:CR=1 FL=1|jgi:exodeoxyribonuclease V alpha subunit